MKFTDILALAKQGYTPNDIKELMALNTDDRQEPTEENNHSEESEADELEKKKDEATSDSDENAIDYKKLYEEEKKLTEKLQNENVRQKINNDNNETDEDILASLVSSFM